MSLLDKIITLQLPRNIFDFINGKTHEELKKNLRLNKMDGINKN